MQFQSKTELKGNYAPIRLNTDFPVANPDTTSRSETSLIPPHVHDCFEIGYCHKGTGVFIVENKILLFVPGDAVVINTKELHIMRGSQGTTTKWDFLNLDPAGLLASYVPSDERFLETLSLSGPDFNNIISGARHPEVCRLILDIIVEIKEKKDGYRSAVRSLVWSLMIKLHRLWPDRKEKASGVEPDRKKLARITPALEFIADNYYAPLEVEALAGLCNSSESNFRKLFHAATGLAPLVYIKNMRMKAASSLLLNTERSILDIALSSGYPTLSNFNRQFRDFYNTSPRNWRNGQPLS